MSAIGRKRAYNLADRFPMILLMLNTHLLVKADTGIPQSDFVQFSKWV